MVVLVPRNLFLRSPLRCFLRPVVPHMVRQFPMHPRQIIHDINLWVHPSLWITFKRILHEQNPRVSILTARLAEEPVLRKSVPNGEPVAHRVRSLRSRLHEPHKAFYPSPEHRPLINIQRFAEWVDPIIWISV